jgi:hypothetical protein
MRGYLTVGDPISYDFFNPLLPVGLHYYLDRLRPVHPEFDHRPVWLLPPALPLDLGTPLHLVSDIERS